MSCTFPSSQRRGGRRPGWSARPSFFAGLTTPLASLASPPLRGGESSRFVERLSETTRLRQETHDSIPGQRVEWELSHRIVATRQPLDFALHSASMKFFVCLLR